MRPLVRKRLLAALVGVLLAVAAAEVALRAVDWGSYRAVDADLRFIDMKDGPYWVFDLNSPQVHEWDRDPYGTLPPGARMTYELNSLGLRGPEPGPRPDVLFLGDSFTFGMGVALENTFVSRVAGALDARLPGAPQVVNAGVPGYGSVQEAARLPSLLADMRPRLVVVVFVPNDPIPLPECVAEGDRLIAAESRSSSRLVRLLSSFSERADAERETQAWYASYYFGGRRARWDAARRALLEMKRLSEASGARFAVVLFPLLQQLEKRPYAAIHEAVAAACREIDAPLLDLTDALAREPTRSLIVHPRDDHPNARAHAIAADAILPFVEALLR
jgi:lysophospholipase L1-like esterase